MDADRKRWFQHIFLFFSLGLGEMIQFDGSHILNQIGLACSTTNKKCMEWTVDPPWIPPGMLREVFFEKSFR